MLRLSLLAAGLLGAGWLAGVPAASAQPGSGDGAAGWSFQALSAGYYLIDFEYDGDAAARPPATYDYRDAAYGLAYARPNLLVTAAFGHQGEDEDVGDMQLLDVSFTTWGGFYPFVSMESGPTRLYLPVVLHSDYRRVSPEGSASVLEDFSVGVLGLGTGLGLGQRVGDEALLEARVNPIIGLASSSFTDALGYAWLVDLDAQLHAAGLFGRAGLSAGYTFRLQHWNVNASDLFPDVTDELLDYRGRMHLLRVGVTW